MAPPPKTAEASTAHADGGLDVDRFVARRRDDWQELERLLDLFDARALSLDSARKLSRLYRAVCADLMTARHELADAQLSDYLDGLVGRAYARVYAVDHAPRFGFGRFLLGDFPRLVRQEMRLVLLSVALFMLGAVAGALVLQLDPEAMGLVVPDMHQIQTPEERVREEARNTEHSASSSAVFSSFLFTHNIQVTFLVFALGITFGVGTAFVLFWNGIPLGALAAQYHASGKGLWFWAWILPHGVVELSVVFFAGAAGFVLARGLWKPGMRSRRSALVQEARLAVRLVLGGMPLLVIAGVVEGTISQMHAPLMPEWVKLTFALVLFVALCGYLSRGATLHKRKRLSSMTTA
jgi:uncharacterized membrane protein SpoIIM required for sporulation